MLRGNDLAQIRLLTRQARNDKEKAKKLISEQLAIKENAELMCTLGDITKDPSLYEKAWTVSRGRCPRAKRALGVTAMEKLNVGESYSGDANIS